MGSTSRIISTRKAREEEVGNFFVKSTERKFRIAEIKSSLKKVRREKARRGFVEA